MKLSSSVLHLLFLQLKRISSLPCRTAFPVMSARGINHQTLLQAVPKSRIPTKNAMPGKYFKIKETWTNGFCCIPYTWSKETPSVKLNEALRKAGLGKKKICFDNWFAKHEEACKKLEEEFVPLKDCGGYTLLRSNGGGVSRPLEKFPVNWFHIKDI